MVVSSRSWPAEFVALVIETAGQDSEEKRYKLYELFGGMGILLLQRFHWELINVTFGFLILESKSFQLLLCYGSKLVNRSLAMIFPQGYFQAVTNANVIFFYLKKKAYIDRGKERMWRALNRRQSFQLEGRLKKPKISKSWQVQNSDSLLFSLAVHVSQFFPLKTVRYEFV